MQFLEELNEPQREAVETIDGPLLILAGAGSGKTRVITTRIAHLIRELRVPADNILAVTFTNKAAGEMRRRVDEMLGEPVPELQVSTFHSFCARVLRRHADRLGYPRNFSIYDQQDTRQLVKRIIAELNLPIKQFAPQAVLARISAAKDRLQQPQDLAREGLDFFNKEVARIYDLYQQRLLAAGALDFDDLIIQTVRLLETIADVRESYQQRFVYVMVDEYQDTNFAQYQLIKLLAEPQGNLCVVGDDDQSIYTWRGADIRNILEFEQDFPDAKTVILEQNYRSTPNILDAAYTVVSGNLRRKEKRLWTKQPEGEKITLLLTESDTAEADLIAGRIKTFGEQGFYALNECVVLYRTNAQSRAFEEAMRRYALPYVLVGGVKFFQRKEVKDVLAYAALIINPRDLIAWRRAINYPKRGLGETTQAKLIAAATERSWNILDFSADPDAVQTAVGPRAAKQVANFIAIIDQLRTDRDVKPLQEWMSLLIERMGVKDELQSEDATQSQTRVENIDELIAAAAEYDTLNPGRGLAGFLEEAALITDVDRWDPDTAAVTLMTLHGAKGLEFPVVFIAGLEEGLFPISRSMEDPQKLAEERRLFYVGATRAEQRLCLSYARTRRRFGETVNVKSRFLEELPKDSLVTENHISYDKLGPGGLGYQRKRVARRIPASHAHRPREMPVVDHPSYTLPHQPGDVAAVLQAGMRVLHPRFGEGTIEAISGFGNGLTCTVTFKTGQTKNIVARFANFEILGV